MVKATAFLDTDIEHELSEEYVACMNNHATEAGTVGAKEAEQFYGGLFRELQQDLDVLKVEFQAHHMKFVRVNNPDRSPEVRAAGDTTRGENDVFKDDQVYKRDDVPHNGFERSGTIPVLDDQMENVQMTDNKYRRARCTITFICFGIKLGVRVAGWAPLVNYPSEHKGKPQSPHSHSPPLSGSAPYPATSLIERPKEPAENCQHPKSVR